MINELASDMEVADELVEHLTNPCIWLKYSRVYVVAAKKVLEDFTDENAKRKLKYAIRLREFYLSSIGV